MAYRDPAEGRAYRRKYCAKNPHKVAEWEARYKAKDPEHVAKVRRAWCTKNERRIRSQRYQRAYGITVEQAEEMLAKQGGCAVCKSNIELTHRGTHIDHCHATSTVRGILCQRCNLQLGHYELWPEFHLYAAIYLGRSRVV